MEEQQKGEIGLLERKETMNTKLEQARTYEKDRLKKIPAEQRPSFHVSSLVGWANDPNGFSEWNGEYHLFYQYHPYSTQWGPMHWGHFKSRDLIHWEALPCALAPDMEYDCDGCFSGGAVEFQGKHYLMYTGVSRDPVSGEVRQAQCIAVGDGVNYEKIPQNPVITGDQLPAGSSLVDFRDPKIWKEGDELYCVVGSRSEDTSGQLVLFRSTDAIHWEFVTVLDRCRNELGKMWECPDFFLLDGVWVGLVSPQDMQAIDLEFHNGNANVCLMGSFDWETRTFRRSAVSAIDYGMDFYATQSLLAPDGRRILIAWMQSWENYLTPRNFQWSGMMTVPRELHVKDGRLYQTPVRELERYYENTVVRKGEASGAPVALEGIRGNVFDMTVTLSPSLCGNLEIRVGVKDRFYSSLQYKGKEGLFLTDRTYSGTTMDLLSTRTMRLPDAKEKVEIRVLKDQYSVEVFLNEGERVMTSLLYSCPGADGVEFQADGPFEVTFHSIQENINADFSL